MIKVEIFKRQSNIVKFVMDGHAGYSNGDDIVCASASSVAWATLNGLEKVAGISFGYQVEDGYIYFVLPDDLKQNELDMAELLLKSYELFIKDLESQYPNYIKVTELEV